MKLTLKEFLQQEVGASYPLQDIFFNLEAEQLSECIENYVSYIGTFTGFKDINGVDIRNGSKVQSEDFGTPISEVKWVQKDGCWALFHESFIRTVTEYKRLTQKNIVKYKMRVVV